MVQGFASNTRLKGVCIARFNFENPPDFIISIILRSPDCMPTAGPFSLKDAGTHTIDDTEQNTLPRGFRLSLVYHLQKVLLASRYHLFSLRFEEHG